jgi:ATP-dependent DNA ligase
VKVKRYRTIDCIVIGVARDPHTPKLVLGLRHPDRLTHHLGVTRALQPAALGSLAPLLYQLGPEEPAIRSRWQHDAVPSRAAASTRAGVRDTGDDVRLVGEPC